MKILVVQESDWFERGPLQQNHLMEMLSLRGHEIRVIDHEILWPEKDHKELISKREVFEDTSRIYENASITVIRPPIVKLPTLDYISLVLTRKKEIERQIKEFKPDVVVGFFMLSAYLGMKAAKKHNIPFVYYWIDLYHTQIPFKVYQPLGEIIEKKVLKEADAVIAINEKLKDKVIEMGSNPHQSYVQRAGLDFERFNHDLDGYSIRKEYNIKDDEIILLFVGVLYHFTGLKEVAEDLGKNKDKYTNIKLLIVGDGDALNELKKIKKKYGLNNQLILTGRQPYDKIPKIISAANICILPAYSTEIMKYIVPIKMYEYMAMSKPVIATNLPGIIAEFGDNNGVFYIKESKYLLNKTLELTKNYNIVEEGKKGRKFVSKNDWNIIADHFEMIMKEYPSPKTGPIIN